MMLNYFLQAVVTYSSKPLLFVRFLGGCSLLYLMYLYVRNSERAKRELAERKKKEAEKILNAQIRTQEYTFKDISQDIHDSACQKLVVVRRVIAETDLAEKTKSILTAGLDDCISDLRDMSNSLSLELLLSSGLAGAIEQEVDVLKQMSLFQIDCMVTGEVVTPEAPVQLHVFRIFQEAIQNAVKHSGATSVTVSLHFEPRQLLLAVVDNGIGFDPVTRRGKGLNHLEARAKILHGSIAITREYPGTRVELIVPIKVEG